MTSSRIAAVRSCLSQARLCATTPFAIHITASQFLDKAHAKLPQALRGVVIADLQLYHAISHKLRIIHLLDIQCNLPLRRGSSAIDEFLVIMCSVGIDLKELGGGQLP